MDLGAPAITHESGLTLDWPLSVPPDFAPTPNPSFDVLTEGLAPAWWETRWFAALLLLVATIPLLWPRIPPLNDLPGHMGRWHIAMEIGRSAALQRYYDFHWALIGNLGADLAIFPLARLFGIEPATKLLVTLIPVLTCAGMMWSAREAHGQLPATAVFAMPLAYAWPFQLGFVNFELSQAFAFLALALWFRLGREQRLRARAFCMVPISWAVWVTHDCGWGMLGLLAFGSEVASLRNRESSWWFAVSRGAVQCLSLATPLLAMLASAHDAGAGTSGDWFVVYMKLGWLASILRDRWPLYDGLALLPLVMLLYGAARSPRLSFAPILAWPAALCWLAFLVLPRLLMGGAYVDMRIAPAALALSLLAIRPTEDRRLARTLALCGLTFLAVRTATTTASFALRTAAQERELAAIAFIPRGAAVLNLVAGNCEMQGRDDRLEHLAGIGIVRRDLFVNEQWTLKGQQLLSIRYLAADPYLSDPSQRVYATCSPFTDYRTAIAGFNRRAFDYVWMIGFPPSAVHARDLALTWTNGRSALYKVMR